MEERINNQLRELMKWYRAANLRRDLINQGITKMSQLREHVKNESNPEGVIEMVQYGKGFAEDDEDIDAVLEAKIRAIKAQPEVLLYLINVCLDKEAYPANPRVQEWVLWAAQFIISPQTHSQPTTHPSPTFLTSL